MRNATYYNMQVWRNGRKPQRLAQRLAVQAPLELDVPGPAAMLSGGQVTVYVWAGFGSKAAANYGPLYGRTRFTVG